MIVAKCFICGVLVLSVCVCCVLRALCWLFVVGWGLLAVVCYFGTLYVCGLLFGGCVVVCGV